MLKDNEKSLGVFINPEASELRRRSVVRIILGALAVGTGFFGVYLSASPYNSTPVFAVELFAGVGLVGAGGGTIELARQEYKRAGQLEQSPELQITDEPI